jgi:hypothetical protein
MSIKTVRDHPPTQEELVADFLHRLPAMRSKRTPTAKESWREVVGTAEGDALDEEAARLGAEWRERMNQSECG